MTQAADEIQRQPASCAHKTKLALAMKSHVKTQEQRKPQTVQAEECRRIT